MPFQIIRNDITKVHADAIVNTANPEPVYAGGTDSAVYRAAGEKRLLKERRKIGHIAPGEAAVTPAFRLHARFIIHTVGPVWIDGQHGEFELLASCYRKSLLLARQLGCRSVAFPLISTGVYGFPKDRALDIALEQISTFLKDEDSDREMDVTLVVFDRKAFDLSSALVEDVGQFIDENYVEARRAQEYEADGFYGSYDESILLREERSRRGLFREGARRTQRPQVPQAPRTDGAMPSPASAPASYSIPEPEKDRDLSAEYSMAEEYEAEEYEAKELSAPALQPAPAPQPGHAPQPAPAPQPGHAPQPAMAPQPSPVPQPVPQPVPARKGSASGIPSGKPLREGKAGFSGFQPRSLQDVIAQAGETFQESLLRMIDERGLTDTQVYKRANLDRRLFSKIRSNPKYNPKRQTAISLGLALELNMDEMRDLLGKAGIALSSSSKFDLIISYCIQNRIYDIIRINAILFDYDQPLLGA